MRAIRPNFLTSNSRYHRYMAKKWISICLLFFIFSACNSKNNKEDSNAILFYFYI
ncbi:hypothetical protein LEP1GSC170_5508 [Leptospira interrogans serovar Bataviae str. HAI135]|nr:hypothetical protein LEP1GSC170_5508 [Leptospira interrogans serovar Bataviae str. HAI135]